MSKKKSFFSQLCPISGAGTKNIYALLSSQFECRQYFEPIERIQDLQTATMKLSFLLFLFASLEPTAANECAECMDFLSKYGDADDSKAAEKQCKVISSVKDVQKACKKTVKDVLKKGKDRLASCKTYGWCPDSRVRVRRTAECEENPTSSPTNEPTSNPTSKPTQVPLK